jgi:LAO/AO transport system kinase
MTTTPAATAAGIAEGVLAGRVRDIGRALSAVETEAGAADLLRALFPSTGRARIVGITGPPGAGKSTLVQRLVQSYRRRGERVAVIAVDPSSPFTGGAILGDRIRMSEIFTDPGVFIRSMATRGALGGLARATGDAVDVLDAAGYDLVLVETVGVGQDEVDIVKAADTIAVVLVPGLGDDIQAIKAGILEIADVFVVNKADREGADRTAAEIAAMLDFTPDRPWRPPIVRTIAPRGEGIEAVVEAIASHESFLRETAEGDLRRERRARERVRQRLQERFRRDVETAARGPQGLEEAIREVLARREDPYSAADRIYGRLVRA